MENNFFKLDFDQIYPAPTPERIAQAYFNRIWRKLHVENFSFLITFYGLHRVGKSLSAVDFAYILDPTFEPILEKRVVYSSKALIQAFKEIRQKRIKGAGVIVDEAGSGDLSSQRWYEEMAKIVSANLQSVGYLNPLVCFVTQNFSFINATARRLSNGVFEVSRSTNIYAIIKPFWIENNPWVSGHYRKYPILCENRDNIPSNVYKVNRIRIGLPPKDIRERYENHSQAHKDKFLSASENELEAMELSKVQKNILVTGIEDIVTDVHNNIDNYKSHNPKYKDQLVINENLIRHEHNLTYRDAKLVKALVEKKYSQPNTK